MYVMATVMPCDKLNDFSSRVTKIGGDIKCKMIKGVLRIMGLHKSKLRAPDRAFLKPVPAHG